MLKTPKSPSTDDRETHDTTTTADGRAGTSRTVADSSTGDQTTRASATPTAPQDPTTELNNVFRVLKNRRRRYVLQLISETAETIHLRDLADEIAAREFEKDRSQTSPEERKRVYVGLYQSHLPKLTTVGAINYDKPRGTIDRGPTFDQYTRYLPTDKSPPKQNAASRSLLTVLAKLLAAGRKLR